MPRKFRLKVQRRRRFSAKRPVRLEVVGIERVPDPRGIRVSFVFLDPKYAGHVEAIVLPLPLQPAGLASSLFQACGLEVVEGGTVSPCEAIGRQVKAWLDARAGSSEFKPVRFEPVVVGTAPTAPS